MKEFVESLKALSLNRLLPSILLLVVGILVIRAIMTLVNRGLKKSRLERAAHNMVRSVLRAVLYLLLGLMVAEKMGINVSGVIALASVASLAISLSLQDALANLIGGFTLLTTQPFKAGDYIDAAGQSGVVKSVNMIYTHLCTVDNKLVSIPNSTMVSSQIVNYATTGSRRVDITVTASYDSEIDTVLKALRKAASIPQRLENEDIFAAVSKYGDNSIEYVLRLWTAAENYWDVYFLVTRRIKAEFDAAGVKMSYPHVNVHMDK